MRAAILALVLLSSVACEPPKDRVRAALDAYGFTDVSLDDYSAFGCSDSDEYLGQKFTAKNPAGRQVKGVVCCGVWKACTVRF